MTRNRWKAAGVLAAMSLTMCAPIFGPIGSGTGTGASGGLLTVSVQGSDVTSTSTSPATITGLSVPVSAGKNYSIHCYFVTSSTNAATAIQLGMDCPSAPTAVTITQHTFSNTTTEQQNSFNTCGNVHAITTSAGATRMINEAHMMIRNATDGNVTGIFNSETGGTTVTVHIGSWCEYYEIQ